MGIVGIGTQIVDCTKVRKLIDHHGEVFLAQVYTEREMRYCNGRAHVTEHFTSVWAAKEAVLRSLGTKWHRGIDWTEIEVKCETGEPPTVSVGGAMAELLAEKNVRGFMLSMAHCRTFATATCIALR